MRTLSLLAFVAALGIASVEAQAGIKYSSQQCKTWFAKIDRNKDGSIGPKENSSKFFDRITLAGASNDSDDSYIMSKSFFIAECVIGSLGKPQS
jgi:hypothetical protein